jgi:purine-nucleoside phosphorylase
MYEKVQETVKFIQEQLSNTPEIGIVLGSGLGNLSDQIEVEFELPYGDIPNFPVSTVKGHKGQLVFGKLGGKQIVAMQGRFHYYEGRTMKEVSFPVRVMKYLGIRLLVLSNAAGGMNPEFKIGDIMLITDHINLFPDNPLMGANDDRFGPRFPDMSEIYQRKYIRMASESASRAGIDVHEGVYVGVSGPTFETPAEYAFFRIAGGDAVGMSTVPEAITARHMGLDCFAVSVITDLGVIGHVENVSHEEVLEAAHKAEPLLTSIITDLIRKV